MPSYMYTLFQKGTGIIPHSILKVKMEKMVKHKVKMEKQIVNGCYTTITTTINY
jgi:hypothetical protein